MDNSSKQDGKKLLDQVRDVIQKKHYSPRTEKTYLDWIRQYILFHNKKHPREMGISEVQAFISHLARERIVSPSTQNQALSAILFLYKYVLLIDLQIPTDTIRPGQLKSLPVILTPQEIRAVIKNLDGVSKLMTQLLYGGGLRVMECLMLRVKDIDFKNHQIHIHESKGDRDRLTILPKIVVESLQSHLKIVKMVHENDLRQGFGETTLPSSLMKYSSMSKNWIWQYVFPAPTLSIDPITKTEKRHHVHESGLQKSIRKAAQEAKINKRVTPHTFRHSFAAHLLQNGYDIRTVQELLGHKDIKTTMIYTQVLQRGSYEVKSPLDD
jgi:integron integrase